MSRHIWDAKAITKLTKERMKKDLQKSIDSGMEQSAAKQWIVWKEERSRQSQDIWPELPTKRQYGYKTIDAKVYDTLMSLPDSYSGYKHSRKHKGVDALFMIDKDLLLQMIEKVNSSIVEHISEADLIKMEYDIIKSRREYSLERKITRMVGKFIRNKQINGVQDYIWFTSDKTISHDVAVKLLKNNVVSGDSVTYLREQIAIKLGHDDFVLLPIHQLKMFISGISSLSKIIVKNEDITNKMFGKNDANDWYDEDDEDDRYDEDEEDEEN